MILTSKEIPTAGFAFKIKTLAVKYYIIPEIIK